MPKTLGLCSIFLGISRLVHVLAFFTAGVVPSIVQRQRITTLLKKGTFAAPDPPK